ncbi:hypothetical protein [Oricola thermophila]|uniref:Uncharacterized protein n=1 Tax=Oricola thermophila TaxID=2742145 RepID=A0A6N1VHU5_9HYPH|nr:hypothetical protein [Oricola thermophila]QKV19275.1 hypothetical protein HTY61_12820 [Oricola thermophila]
MTYPFPVQITVARRRESMTPEEVDKFYDTHAEPLPGWLLAPFVFARRIAVALRLPPNLAPRNSRAV